MGQFTPARRAQDRTWKLYGDGRFVNWSEDPDELQALEDTRSDEHARIAKSKLQGVLNRMPPTPQTISED